MLRRSGAAGTAAADAAGNAAAAAATAVTAAAAAPPRSLAILQLGDTSIGDVGAAAIARALDAGAMPCGSMATLGVLAATYGSSRPLTARGALVLAHGGPLGSTDQSYSHTPPAV